LQDTVPLRAIGWAALAVVLGACSLAPDPAPPVAVTEIPEAFEAGPDSSGYEPTRWWEDFGDPALDALVDSVLAANLDVAEAVARVLEARASVGIATADLLPSVDAQLNADRQNQPTNAGFGRFFSGLGGADTASAGPAPPARFTLPNYSAALSVSYELDFWGRARNDRAATVRELEASDADLQTAILGVIGETITAWYQAADLRERVRLSSEIVDVLLERAELAQTRYDRGLITSFELYQIRQDLQTTQATLPQLKVQLAEAEGRLAVLAGRYPGAMAGLLADLTLPGAALPDVPASIPADLLWQRPDVRAAGQRLDAARLRVGARRAELLPSLNLTGTFGLQSAEVENWFDIDQWFSNLVAGIVAPIFRGGRLRANVAAARARLEQQTAAYGRIVITAVVEAENALGALRQEEERFLFLQGQAEEAESSADLQARRFQSGVAGYADYLDALRNQLLARSTLAGAARDYALARLAVHRALGGDWVGDQDETQADQPLP
jgi:NodT family efflux transporter outer membrane factor (OMF) lipoprotein